MVTHLSSTDRRPGAARDWTDEADRWHAVRTRDASADGRFCFAVKTTGVYCRPGCGARLPRRDNVVFYDSNADAEAAGYRPCKRCRPGAPSTDERHAALVAAACREIETAEREPALRRLAAAAGLSPHHFQRVFKRIAGVTPKQYALATRAGRLKHELRRGGSVTDAIYASGHGASSRFYGSAGPRLGMTATAFKDGGRGVTIRYACGRSWLGPILVAATERGICAILIDDERRRLVADLERRFPRAVLEQAEPGSGFEDWVSRTVAFLERPANRFDLPLDVQATAFQERVWRALLTIPPGHTASYGEIARRIGRPNAARAVARACAANPVAVAIPCHRVVREDGGPGGYRWGGERKRRLLERESG